MSFTKREEKYLTRKINHSEDTDTQFIAWVLVFSILILSIVIHVFFEPNQVKAQTRGPMTNKEVCEYLARGEYRIPPGQISETADYCKKYGIKI